MPDIYNVPPLPSGLLGTLPSLTFGLGANESSKLFTMQNGLPDLPSLGGSESGQPNSPSSTAGSMVDATPTSKTSNPNNTKSATNADGLLARGAYLLLAIAVIAGAIWTYKK